MKKLLISIGIILAIYISFVTIDCIRLRNSSIGTKPLITISLAEHEKGDKYVGLGYTIAYYKDSLVDANANVEEKGYGAEFRLFDKMLVWAWVE